MVWLSTLYNSSDYITMARYGVYYLQHTFNFLFSP